MPVNKLLITMAAPMVLSMLIGALLSRFLGERKQRKVDQTALHGIILGIGFYILVLLFGIFCVRGFYMVQTNDAEIVSMGIDYLTVICVFGFGQMFQLIFEKILQSTGHTSHTMVMQMVGAYFKLQTFVYMAIFGLNNALIPIVAIR